MRPVFEAEVGRYRARRAEERRLDMVRYVDVLVGLGTDRKAKEKGRS